MARRKRKNQWGGKRPGAGRPPAKTVRLSVTVSTDTAGKLERMAKARGLSRRKGAPPYYGTVIDEIVSGLSMPEPEYLKIAREALRPS